MRGGAKLKNEQKDFKMAADSKMAANSKMATFECKINMFILYS